MTVQARLILWHAFALAAALWLIIGVIAGLIAALLTRSLWSAVALAPWALAQAGEAITRRQLRTALQQESRD